MKLTALFTMFGVALLLAGLGGCQQEPAERPPGFSLDRGAQLLAGGSPKSAIPFLTQTVAGVPDGPEPVALLSLAYALDLQHERAILQAKKVRRPAGSPPGWEAVAVGIAWMLENRPDDAVTAFGWVEAQTPAAAAARQWSILAQLLDSKPNDAIQALEKMTTDATMGTSATLWMTIIHEQTGHKDLAIATLRRCAQSAASTSGQMALRGDLSDADGQTLYDAGLAAVAQGDLVKARELLSRVQDHTIDGCDTALWLALISGIREDWQTARNQLSAACETGSGPSRGLASQLFSVVCALENRPVAVIQFTLLGQRMMGRSGEPAYIHEQAQPEPVWGSDQMH